ncbi:putative sensor domain DACNV-containing protein [Hyalangium rubrum]|uniref:Probable sensor domain-containing protein n=1 Tax=Hyalangium rubrum TaxID=3103134 RepID=A0ABU5GX20_9BACT|nr:hypothetical protein [Hyalangium sp. s54d21]MDY7225738.1 hypothetical protein [Hyalangium sp. s54d21]
MAPSEAGTTYTKGMASPHKYPRDVVKAMLDDEEFLREVREEMTGTPEPSQGPSSEVLEQLVETMLFASMATEEGRIEPVGVVFAEAKDDFEAGPRERMWDLMTLRVPRAFTVPEVTKLASICDIPRSFLAVVRVGGELKILGVATPGVRLFLSEDRLVRVLAPRTGTVVVYRGPSETVRYERGTIYVSPPPYLGTAQRRREEQMTSIARDLLSSKTRHSPLRIFTECSQLVAGMSQRGHGGIIAILGPDDDPAPLIEGSRELAQPIRFGAAIREHQDLEDEENPLAHAERAIHLGTEILLALPGEQSRSERVADRLDQLRQQIVRLATVDGAVVMSHSLDVLAFGVKLPAGHDAAPEVCSVNANGELGARWPSERHGTRHRAAAAFASMFPKGLALIVSQDGGAAVFHTFESKVVCWPLSISVAGSR